MAFKTLESVLVVVHAADLQILLLEWAGKAGMCQSVTGSREPGDADLAATARRELSEETGLGDGTLTDWRLTNRYEIWPQWRAAMDKVFSPTDRDAIWQLQKRIAA